MLRVNNLTGFGARAATVLTQTIRALGPYMDWLDAQVAPTLDGETHGWSNNNMRHVISSLAYGGDGVRVVLQGGDSGGFTYDALYIGEQAASGDAYDMKSSGPTPAQLTVNGSGTIAVPAGHLVYTDKLSFPIDASKTYVISGHIATGDDYVKQHSGSTTGIESYYNPGTSEASTANASSGYTGPGTSRGVKGLQVETVNTIFSPTIS